MKQRLFAFLFLAIVTVQQSLACPNCKDAYTPGSTGASIGESYSWSVLFMLLMPLLTIAMITMRIVFAAKKQRNNDL